MHEYGITFTVTIIFDITIMPRKWRFMM